MRNGGLIASKIRRILESQAKAFGFIRFKQKFNGDLEANTHPCKQS
jgi:hypothetical protein